MEKEITMAKKQLKNRYTGEVIFECEAKTIKECVEKAVSRKANLRKANLQEVDLWKANLQEANLQEVDLWKANLRKANLRKANLRKANLRKANLQEANLRKANLNAVFYKTKITKKQRIEICEESDLFEVMDDDSPSLEAKE